MSLSDPIADILTRIRNAQLSRKKNVLINESKFGKSILKILLEEGYILSYESIDHRMISVELKYHKLIPAISVIKRVSRPGLRFYVRKDKISKVFGGLGIAIISTSSGLMTDKKARSLGFGGELICTVF